MSTPQTNEEAPDVIRTPKPKDPNAVHPGVAASRFRARARGIGVVYGHDGAPRIDAEFIEGLSAEQRIWVAGDLEKHGYRLNADNSVTKLEDSQ